MQTVKQLIEHLQKMNPNLPAYIFDARRNLAGDMGEGSGDGIYKIESVEEISDEDLPPGIRPWVAIEFSNPDYSEDGAYLAN